MLNISDKPLLYGTSNIMPFLKTLFSANQKKKSRHFIEVSYLYLFPHKKCLEKAQAINTLSHVVTGEECKESK